MAETASTAPSPVAADANNKDALITKYATKVKQLNEANTKYKNLLKMAKDRIQQQEDEIEELKKDKSTLAERLEAEEKEAAKHIALDETSIDRNAENLESHIVRVCQRIKNRIDDQVEEIWALMDMEVINEDGSKRRQYKEWMRFDTESELQDFIRRDTGEPLTLPPYSLSSDQSAKIQKETDDQVSKITEEFRRFRVRAELARKQADAQIRDLQNSKAQKAAQTIEGRETTLELEQARSMATQLERLKAEMVAQEAHWKESYDALLSENNKLKSSGSEALLAAQWRQRYENCLKEKEDLESRLHMSSKSPGANGDAEKHYEMKYRDLKESFRLYRKKAKEIFEAQQIGDGGVSSAAAMNITSNSPADAKLSYLKNLMLNYLTADPAVRGHMESAIATVLQFSVDEKKKIEEKQRASDAWF